MKCRSYDKRKEGNHVSILNSHVIPHVLLCMYMTASEVCT